MHRYVLGAWLVLSTVLAPQAIAQNYPDKPIRIIVTFPAGGPTDIVARAIGQKLTEAWGQQVIVDNRGGAGGVIGTELAVKANLDGYTLLLGTSSGLSINPAINPKLSYDPFKDLTPVSLVVINPQILVVHPSLNVSTVQELLRLARERPGQLNYGSVGQGSPQHLGMELLNAAAGTKMVHIPYKGTTPALTDLLAGQVSLMFNSMPSVLPHVRTGKLKGLAVGSAKRSPAAPEIPTVAESGVPGFEYVTWYGIFAPANTPRSVVMKLNAAIVKMLGEPDMGQRLASQGAEPAPSSPEQLAKYMHAEYERWRTVIKSAGIKPE